MKKIIAIFGGITLSLAAVAVLAVGPAKAADFIAPTGNDGAITINRTETHHNLYVAGGDVSINSPTTGDLYVAGGTISIDGSVEQDVVVAGGTVIISEPVNGDVRVAGGQVTINAPVKGDVLVGAGTLKLSDKASVGGELRVAGGTITVDGPVASGVYLAGGNITVNSKITGLVKITANNELKFGPLADIANEVSYVGKTKAVVDSGAKVSVSFTEQAQQDRNSGKRTGIIGFLVGGFIIKFLAMVLAGLLFLHFFRNKAMIVTESMLLHPWTNLAIGFAVAIAAPIAIIIALVLLVGFYIALIAMAAYMLAILIAALISAIFIGSWAIKLLTKKPHLILDWQAIVLGAAILILLPLIPIVGFLICAVLFLIAFGALVTTRWQSMKQSSSVDTSPVS